MTEDIYVVKRNGRGKERLDINKIHDMMQHACEGISGVSSSLVITDDFWILQFYNGMSTDDIQQILIRSASDLISLEAPNYQYVAARLLLFSLRKSLFGRLWDHPKLSKHIDDGITAGVYDHQIKEWYSQSEIDRMDQWVDSRKRFLIYICWTKTSV